MEREGSFTRKGKSKYGTPLFVSEEIDPTTGVKRTVEKTIYAKGAHTLYALYKQTDILPSFDLTRTIARSSPLLGKDIDYQGPPRLTEEKIEIKKIDNSETSLRILVTKYSGDKGEEITVESVSLAKSLWNGAKCEVYYNPDTGNVYDMSLEGNFDMVTIDLEDPKHFEIIDNDQPLGEDIKKREKIDFSEVFGSEDLEFILEESKEGFILLRVKNMRDQKTISLVIAKTIDIDELYTLASTEGFTGWEKAIEKADEYLNLNTPEAI